MSHHKVMTLISLCLITICVFTCHSSEIETRVYINEPLNEDNEYKFHYELSDGQLRIEEGSFGTDENGKPIHLVTGQYEYQSPDGKLQRVYYSADENGFQANANRKPGLFTYDLPVMVSSLLG